MEFIKSLISPTKELNNPNHLYLNVLTIATLLEYMDTAEFGQNYLWDTFKSKSFNNPNRNSTDFYLLLNSYLKENPSYNIQPLIDWAKLGIKGRLTEEYNNKLFLKLENDLRVNENLKALRRNITFEKLMEYNNNYNSEITPLLESIEDARKKGSSLISKIGKATCNMVKKTILAGAMLAAAPILGTMIGISLQNKKLKNLGEAWNNNPREKKPGIISKVGKGLIQGAKTVTKNLALPVAKQLVHLATNGKGFKISENASVSSTSAGSIATTVASLRKCTCLKRDKNCGLDGCLGGK